MKMAVAAKSDRSELLGVVWQFTYSRMAILCTSTAASPVLVTPSVLQVLQRTRGQQGEGPMQVKRTVLAAALSGYALLTLVCAAEGAPTTPASGKEAVTRSNSPDARGRAVLKAQLAALADEQAFMATFAATATVLTPYGSSEVHASDVGAAAAIAQLNPHAEVKSATFDHFMSGSAGQLSWFAADLHITVVSHEPENPPSTTSSTVRAIELLDGAVGWKVTVAAFTSVGKLHTSGTSSISQPTDPGPLANLLLSPDALAGALGDGAVVYGTDVAERGLRTGDARALLGRWKKLTISLDESPKVHEVRGATYGYAMANVRVATKLGGPNYRLNAFVLALPTPAGKWSVVGASFGAL